MNINIRKIEDDLESKLRIQAAENGHSLEEEARRILHNALDGDPVESPRDTSEIPQDLSLEERLNELEKRGIWVRAKDPVKRFPRGKREPGALDQFLAERHG